MQDRLPVFTSVPNPDAAARLRRWSTEGLPEYRRLDYWTDAVSTALFGMSVVVPSTARFWSVATATSLDALTICAIVGSGRLASRGADDIRRANDAGYCLSVDFSRCWSLTVEGRRVALEPGDLVVVDIGRIHSAYYADESAEPRMHIRLPAQWLAKWVRDPDALVGRRLAGTQGWSKVLSAYVRQLGPEAVLRSPVAHDLLADHLGGLLTLVELEQSSAGDRMSVDTGLAGRIVRDIRDRSSDIALSVGEVASELGVSKRTLHRHLSTIGKTFGGVLQESRVQAALGMLESANAGSLTTAEIGFRAGFADPSHFVRVMAHRLEKTPARYRKAFIRRIADARTRELAS